MKISSRMIALLPIYLSLFCSALFAQYPSNYYDSIDDTTSQSLRQSLHTLISNHTRYPYTSTSIDTWGILELANEFPLDGSKILDIYYNEIFTKQTGGNPYYEREHAWPKSYGFPNDLVSNYPYTDCHNLFLAYASYNASRGNTLFRKCLPSQCDERPTIYNYGHGGGSTIYPGNSNWRTGSGATGTWQVWLYRKGDIARALMYMDIRYEGGTNNAGYTEPDLILTDNESLISLSNTGSNEQTAYMGELSSLLEWHYEDGVNSLEIQHNDVVYVYQGNRNPFVDHPEWVTCVFQNYNCGAERVFIDRFETGDLSNWIIGE